MFTPSIKWLRNILEVLHQNTHEMPTSSASSTPQNSCARFDRSQKRRKLPLLSTFRAIPSLILPPACSDVEHPPRNFNTAEITNSSPAPSTTPSNTMPIPPCTLTSSLIFPPADIPEICYCVNTVRQTKNSASICNSDQKLYFTPEISRTRMSPPFIHHQLLLYSPTQHIRVLELPPSVFDAGCLPCNSNSSHTRDSGLLLPAMRINVDHLPHFFAPSSLQSPFDDIPTLCLPPTLSQE